MMKSMDTANTSPQKLSSSQGFTLIEIIVVIGLMALVFYFYNSLIQTVGFTNRGRFDDIGLSVAVEQLEIYRATEINLLPDTTQNISDPNLNLLPNGNGAVTITDYGSEDSGIKQIVVQVNWTDKGNPRDVTLTSLLTSGGVGK